MKKNIRKIVFAFALGIMFSGGIVVASSQIFANNIGYKQGNVEDTLDNLYDSIGGELPNSETYSNYLLNNTRETDNAISLSNLEKGEYICLSYYMASSYESASGNGETTSVTYEIDGCDAITEYNNNGHWNAANTGVASGIHLSVMSRDNSFRCKINSSNKNITVNYHPKSRTDGCSVSLYISCTKIK